jgi:catechol 2,3-dioxygenase-like lactoylglutathione lyase family enzyme
MLDHITIRVSDINTTKEFYKQVLAPLGYAISMDFNYEGVQILGFGKDGRNDTWITNDKPISGPTHLAYKANSKEEVNSFYEEAIKADGKDNGAPGDRPEYGENYYGAFVLDPDGNNIEAVFRGSFSYIDRY